MNNLHKHNFLVDQKNRSKRLNQTPKLIWFTGLSGSGKSTLAAAVEKKLFDLGYMTYSLDGDNIRMGICNNLGFNAEDRAENIRRIAEVSKLILDAGLVVCASFISPFKKDRQLVQSLVGKENYFEVFVNTPLEVCQTRDVKGLYAKAKKGEIKEFTGISSPYEPPVAPNVIIDTSKISVSEATNIILDKIKPKLS